MSRLAIRNAFFFGRARLSRLIIPWCTYTEPEVARVGLSVEEAREQGLDVDTFVQPFSGVDRSILETPVGATPTPHGALDDGFVRLHCRKGTDQIVGGTIIGPHAGDLIGQVTCCMQHRIGLKQMANVIYPYPTRAEAIRKLGDQFNRTRLTPLTKRVLRQILRWRR
jgi:pyruvate/2-oxoglutarate dehydrogenase complex dihydrolipoamide dehydrogenase (E3) component